MKLTFPQQPESKKKRSKATNSSLENTFSPAVELGAAAGVPLFLQRSNLPQTATLLQAKLTANESDDVHEQEADRIATQVMNQPKLTSLQPIQQKTLLRKEIQPARSSDAGIQAESSLESRLSSSKGTGSPLADDVRSTVGWMGDRF